MEWLALVLVSMALGGGGLWVGRWLRRKKRRHSAHAEVETLKLSSIPPPSGLDAALPGLNLLQVEAQLPTILERLGGVRQGLPVRVWVAGDESALQIQILVGCPEKLPGDLTAFRQGTEPAQWIPLAGRVQDIFTGDDRFDEGIKVRGSAMHLVRSALDHSRRSLILSALADLPQLQILRMCLVARFSWAGTSEKSLELEPKLRRMLELSQALQPTTTPAEALLAIVREDPEPVVRRRCVESLGKRYLQQPGVVEGLRLALQDRDWLVRLAAARALGDEAMEALAHLLHVSARPWPEFVITAIAEQGHPAFLPILRSAITSSIPAVHALGRMRDKAGVPKLLKTYPSCTRAEHREAILVALGQIGDPEAEDMLLRELDNPENSTPVRAAAVASLGACGGPVALQHLQPFTRVAIGGGLRTVALEAVTTIQARLATPSAPDTADSGGGGAVEAVSSEPHLLERPVEDFTQPFSDLAQADATVLDGLSEEQGREGQSGWQGLTLSSLEWQRLGAQLSPILPPGPEDPSPAVRGKDDPAPGPSLPAPATDPPRARRTTSIEDDLRKALDWMEETESDRFPSSKPRSGR